MFPEDGLRPQVYNQLLCFFGVLASSFLSSLHTQGFLKARQQAAAWSPIAHKCLIWKDQSRCVHKCFEVGLSVLCVCALIGDVPARFPEALVPVEAMLVRAWGVPSMLRR